MERFHGRPVSLRLPLLLLALAVSCTRASASSSFAGAGPSPGITIDGRGREQGRRNALALRSSASSPRRRPNKKPGGRKTAPVGPCSSRLNAPVVSVRSQGNIESRLRWKNSTTVILLLRNDVVLSSALILNASYSCTIFTRDPKLKTVSLIYKMADVPPLTIQGSNNILFIGVNLYNFGVTSLSPQCQQNWGEPCPSLVIYKSWNIQYVKATIFGQVVVQSSVSCWLDSLTITAPPLLNSSNVNKNYLASGLVSFGQTGVGINRPITPSNNVLSNSRVFGANILVSLTGCAVGTAIRNNYFSNFAFAAIRCGNLVHFMMDCHANTFANNYVYRVPKTANQGLGDSGAFYFSSKWFNPGNRLICNYIYGGDYCYYFDFASSGILIAGGACVYSKGAVVKLNTGKWNKIRSMIIIGPAPPQVMSCICTGFFNCSQDPGNYYQYLYSRFYNLPSINQAYPLLQTVCSPSYLHSVGGLPCEPAGSQPVTCSGLPYGNDNEYIVFNRNTDWNVQGFCTSYPAVNYLNKVTLYNFTNSQAGFLGRNNFGVRWWSKIRKTVPKFVDCPRWRVGPKLVRPTAYYATWNRPEPQNYKLVLTAVYCFGATCGWPPAVMA